MTARTMCSSPTSSAPTKCRYGSSRSTWSTLPWFAVSSDNQRPVLRRLDIYEPIVYTRSMRPIQASFALSALLTFALGCADGSEAIGWGGAGGKGDSGGSAGTGTGGSGGSGGLGGEIAPPASADPTRDIVSTALTFDLSAMTASATIQLAPSA